MKTVKKGGQYVDESGERDGTKRNAKMPKGQDKELKMIITDT